MPLPRHVRTSGGGRYDVRRGSRRSVRLRRTRDQMDREYVRPLDVEALARTVTRRWITARRSRGRLAAGWPGLAGRAGTVDMGDLLFRPLGGPVLLPRAPGRSVRCRRPPVKCAPGPAPTASRPRPGRAPPVRLEGFGASRLHPERRAVAAAAAGGKTRSSCGESLHQRAQGQQQKRCRVGVRPRRRVGAEVGDDRADEEQHQAHGGRDP